MAFDGSNVGPTAFLDPRSGREPLGIPLRRRCRHDAEEHHVGCHLADLVRPDAHEPCVVDPAKVRSQCKSTPIDATRVVRRERLDRVAGGILRQKVCT